MSKVVVIAASEGGLEPLRTIIAGLPQPCRAAICIVWHIGRYQSMLPDILSRTTRLPVAFAAHGDILAEGHIYVAPPDQHLLLGDNRLILSHAPKVNHTRPAANPLFMSAAQVFGSRAMGVILSGGDGDGALGLRMIKEEGGIALVQCPMEAINPEMPLSALLADYLDDAVSAADLALRVRRFCADP